MKRSMTISQRLLLLFLAVAVLPLAAFGYLNLRQDESALRTEVLARMSDLADKKSSQLKSYLAERVQDVRMLARGPRVMGAIEVLPEEYAAGRRQATRYVEEDGKTRRYFERYVEETGLFYDVFLISPQGEVVYSQKREADFAANLLTGPWRDTQLAQVFRAAQMTLEPAVSGYELYAPSQAPAMFVAAPILIDGKLRGVFAVQLGNELLYRVATDAAGLGQSGEVTFAQRDGDGVLYATPLKYRPDAEMRFRQSQQEIKSMPTVSALAGESGVGVGPDYRGEQVAAAWRYLPELGWGMVVKIDADEVFAAVGEQRRVMFKVLLGCLLFSGLVAYYLGRQISKPLKALSEVADEVAQGRLDRRADESAAGELGLFARSFNRMADNLRELYRTLEARIEERTRELNVTNEQLQEEVTERMHTELTLQISNDELLLYKRFMDSSSNAMGMGLLDGQLTYANRAFLELLGVPPAELGRHLIHEFFTDERLRYWRDEVLPAALREGAWSGEILLTNRDGALRDTTLELFVVKDSKAQPYALAAVITDITERKSAERALQSSQQQYEHLTTNIPIGVYLAHTGASGALRFKYVSARFCAMLGVGAEAVYADSGVPFQSIHPDDLADFAERNRSAVQRRENFQWDGRTLVGGMVRWVHIESRPECPDSDECLWDGIVMDITDRKLAQLELQRNQDLLNEAQRLGHLGSWELDLVRGELRWSDEIYRIFELDPARFSPSYENFLNAIHPDDRDKVNQAYSQSLVDRQPYDVVHRLLMPDGRIKWVREHCNSKFDEAGKPLRSVGAVQDITVQRRADEQLRVAAATFETHEAIMITDVNANILRVNRAFEETTGYNAEEVLGKNPRILSSGRQDKNFYAEMWQALKAKGAWTGEMWDRRKGGQVYPKWLTITAVKNELGETTEYVAIFSDITARKQAEEEIRNLAFYDALTQLPNRRLLLDRLHLALSVSARNQSHGALLFLDMDRFKVLNDTLGHDYGDLLLIEVAARIKNCVREVDTVARLGGDEFVVLIEEAGKDTADASRRVALIAEKIRASLADPYRLKDNVHRSSPSIGVSLFLGNAEPVEVLLKQADMAMYQAKESGRNAVRFFDPQMQLALETRARLEADLRNAVVNDELRLYYQVQVDRDFRPLGVEALVRWQHPERGMVPPGQFIPIAEESSLILDIGGWVLETACRQLALWRNHRATSGLTVAVNVSAAQFRQAGFVDQVSSLLLDHRVDPSRLKLELTESVVMSDVADVVAKMQALKALGIKLSMDDFGTGYSSLSYLKNLPLDQIKIDQSFVRDITSDSNDAVMVRTIIDMAQNFGLDVVAEGVETEEQRLFLKRHGCGGYQGYLFSKPVPVEEFEKSLGGL